MSSMRFDDFGMLTNAARAFLASLLVLILPDAVAQGTSLGCGSLHNAFGPYDYRTDRDKLPIVEGAHFTPEVEALIRGVQGYIAGDLDYTLRAFPNHHRALVAMARLFERSNWNPPTGARYSIDCYFDRALRFRPDDVVARLIFVSYLAKRSRKSEALSQLERAASYASGNGMTYYNIGFQYFELREFDLAAKYARQAQVEGFTGQALIERLRAAGHWTERPAGDVGSTRPAPASSPER